MIPWFGWPSKNILTITKSRAMSWPNGRASVFRWWINTTRTRWFVTTVTCWKNSAMLWAVELPTSLHTSPMTKIKKSPREIPRGYLTFPWNYDTIYPLSARTAKYTPVWWNWQTWRTQNPLMATSCGFESHHRHQKSTVIMIPSRIVKAVLVFLFKSLGL